MAINFHRSKRIEVIHEDTGSERQRDVYEHVFFFFSSSVLFIKVGRARVRLLTSQTQASFSKQTHDDDHGDFLKSNFNKQTTKN